MRNEAFHSLAVIGMQSEHEHRLLEWVEVDGNGDPLWQSGVALAAGGMTGSSMWMMSTEWS
jgi:hypothetical protein